MADGNTKNHRALAEGGAPTVHRKERDLIQTWDTATDKLPLHTVQYAYETPEREEAFKRSQFPTAEEWERYQWYRSEWHRRPKEEDPGPAPLAVTCELVSSCNLACTMCYTISKEFENSITGAQRMMSWPVVKAVIDECAALGVPSMLFSWRGEATLYKGWEGKRKITFPDVLKYARAKGILEITAVTHGQLIDEEMAKAIIDAEPSWISFSIDGMGDTYNKIRTPKNKKGTDYDAFSVVMKNIERLADIRNAAGKTRPQIRTNAIFPAVAENPELYWKTLEAAGVDMITVNELLDLRGGDLEEGAIADQWGCAYPFQRLTVSANGILLPCTGAYHEQSGLVLGHYEGTPPKQTRNDDGTLAVTDMGAFDLKATWHGEVLKNIRQLHVEGRRSEIEPGCRHCNHGAKKHGADRDPAEWDNDAQAWVNTERKG